MSLRRRRKFTSSTFELDGKLCKVFLEPWYEYSKGFWVWNVGFAIGNSRRQLNDWYHQRQNKRARGIRGKFIGKSGLKAIRKGFEEVQRIRWSIPPGDVLIIDCTSGDPDRQYRAFSRWSTLYPDFIADPIKKEFHWSRPPYPHDEVWKDCHVTGYTPKDLRMSTVDRNYYRCFYIRLKRPDMSPSSARIAGLLDLALTSE